MNPEQFVTWFKGFVQAANTFNITPKQWDTICEYLEKVKDPNHEGGYLISNKPGRYGTTTTTAERRDTSAHANGTQSTKILLTDNNNNIY